MNKLILAHRGGCESEDMLNEVPECTWAGAEGSQSPKEEHHHWAETWSHDLSLITGIQLLTLYLP